MFNSEFFPTPPALVDKMCKDWFYSLKDHPTVYILDPSAGKGDILDWFGNAKDKHYNRIANSKTYAIEISKDLQHILTSKEHHLIGTDFLQYNGDIIFDAIIMNPPFSNGDKHFLKAWDVLEAGYFCCILNAETIRNPYTESRQLIAKIISDNNGKVEYFSDAFKGSERPTGVEIAMVKIYKKAKEGRFDFNFKKVSSEKGVNLTDDLIRDSLATNDIVGNMIQQFEAAKVEFVKYIKARAGVYFYLGDLNREYYDNVADWMSAKDTGRGSLADQYNVFVSGARAAMWAKVIKQLKIERYMTREVQQNFDSFIKQQGALEFTKENVRDLIFMLRENGSTILDRAIVEVFETFTKYHSENRLHIEGWKTNDSWKVNQKVILPSWVKYGEYSTADDLKRYGSKFSLRYSREYNDIDKVLCYISGTVYEDCHLLSKSISQRFESLGSIRTGETFDSTGESQFFNWRFYRKGTLHIEFKDKWLWQEFNMRACEGKNWLPEAEKRAWKEAKSTSIVVQ
jgi:hypothetical protein